MTFKKLAVSVVALAITSPIVACSAPTGTADKATMPASSTPVKPSAQEQAILKFSEAGNSAMRDVRGARLAIFTGDPKTAMKLMESAKTFIAQAEKDAPMFDTTSTMLVGGKVVGTTSTRRQVKSVPVDGQVMLADNFVMTPEKKTHIDKANEHLKKGERANAVEELRLGDIDVTYTRSWLPIMQSKKHIEQAIKLAGDGKFYEANLALKAIEDGVTSDSVSVDELPQRSAN